MWDLKHFIKELGWSQAELARRLKVNKNTVNNWVGGETPQVVRLYLELLCRLKEETK